MWVFKSKNSTSHTRQDALKEPFSFPPFAHNLLEKRLHSQSLRLSNPLIVILYCLRELYPKSLLDFNEYLASLRCLTNNPV